VISQPQTKFSATEVLKLYDWLEKSNLKIWLDGGWGVDALLGKQTREHADLDIVIEQKNASRLRKYLENQSYVDVERGDTSAWNFVLGDNHGHQVDFHVVVFDEQGNGSYGPPENGDMYPEAALVALGKINGQQVRCLTPEYQLTSHTGYNLKEKDFHDVLALCEKFELPVPREYENH